MSDVDDGRDANYEWDAARLDTMHCEPYKISPTRMPGLDSQMHALTVTGAQLTRMHMDAPQTYQQPRRARYQTNAISTPASSTHACDILGNVDPQRMRCTNCSLSTRLRSSLGVLHKAAPSLAQSI